MSWGLLQKMVLGYRLLPRQQHRRSPQPWFLRGTGTQLWQMYNMKVTPCKLRTVKFFIRPPGVEDGPVADLNLDDISTLDEDLEEAINLDCIQEAELDSAGGNS